MVQEEVLIAFRRTALRPALVLFANVMLAACGSDTGSLGAGSAQTGELPGTSDGAFLGSDQSECELLTLDEVTAEIGPNDGGMTDFLLGGCAWTADVPSTETGFVPRIHVSVMGQIEYSQLADLDGAEAVDDFADGATFGPLNGELWWQCGDQYCVVKAALFDGDARREAALRLGELVKGRI